MKTVIGCILSDPIYSFMKCLEQELAPHCVLKLLCAHDNDQAITLYKEHRREVDCLVFSGAVYYYIVIQACGTLEKPSFILDEVKTDIRQIFLDLVMKDRQFDFSRVFVDFAVERNKYLGIKEMLPKDQWPLFNDLEENEYIWEHSALVQRHRQLYEEKRIDVSITRFGTILKDLDAMGIPYRYAYPSKDYAVNFFMQIANTMKLEMALEKPFATIVIEFEHIPGDPGDGPMLRCEELIADFVRLHGYDFMIQKEANKLIVLSRYDDLSNISYNFTDDGFKQHLEAAAGTRLFVGIGAGRTIYQATQNAGKAALMSRSGQGVYYCSEAETMLGPIGAEHPGVLHANPDSKAIERSARLHVDHINLQKIISYTKLRHSTKISADELAHYLSVTVRSANRILNTIEQNGGARSYREKLGDGRGRPKKYYDLIFVDTAR